MVSEANLEPLALGRRTLRYFEEPLELFELLELLELSTFIFHLSTFNLHLRASRVTA